MVGEDDAGFDEFGCVFVHRVGELFEVAVRRDRARAGEPFGDGRTGCDGDGANAGVVATTDGGEFSRENDVGRFGPGCGEHLFDR